MLRKPVIALLVCALGGLPATQVAHAAEAAFAWPVDGEVITPYRNGDDPYAAGMHRGIDIAAPPGTTVRAATAGTVAFAGRLPDGALDVTIRGASGRYLVSHMHLASVRVKTDTRVSLGEPVGTAGSSGRPSSAQPHVHLGVRLAASGAYVDPLALLPPIRKSPPTAPVTAGAAAAPAVRAPARAHSASRAGEGRAARPLTTQVTLRGNTGARRQLTRTRDEIPAANGAIRGGASRPSLRAATHAPKTRASSGLTAPGLAAERPARVAARNRETLQVRGPKVVDWGSSHKATGSISTRATDLPQRDGSVRTLWSIALLCVMLAAGIALWRRRAPLPPAPLPRVAAGRPPSRAARAGSSPATRRSPV